MKDGIKTADLSMLKYMNSGVFNPQVAVKQSIIEDLLRD